MLVPVSDEERLIHDLLSRGLALHHAGRPADAARLYRQLLAIVPSHPDALHLLALAAKVTGPVRDAGVGLFVRALAVRPDFAAAWTNLSAALCLLGRGVAAGRAGEVAVALDPGLTTAYVRLSAAALEQGVGRRAAAMQERAVGLCPGDAAQEAALERVRHMAGIVGDAARVLGLETLTPAVQRIGAALGRVASYFDQTLHGHGATSLGVSHDDPDLHRRTLVAMAGIIDDAAGTAAVVHDIGCGYGLLFDLIRDHPALVHGRYRGFDISPAMIAHARAHTADPRASFVVASDPDEPADFTIVAGTYNLKMDCGDEAWMTYVGACLRRLAANTRHGLALNMLSSHAPVRHEGLFYPDPARMLSLVLETLTPRAVLIHDYSPAEWLLLARGPFNSTAS